MHPSVTHARALTFVVSGMLCLAAGCQSVPKPGATPPQAEGGSVAQSLELSAAAERRAAAMAHFAAATSIEMNEGVDAALGEYQQALELDPQNVTLALRLANIHLARKEMATAITILETTAKANPNVADAWLWLGIAHQLNDQPAKAMTAFRRTLRIDPSQLGATRALVDLLLQKNQTAEAAKVLDAAFRQRSDDPRHWAWLGRIYTEALKQKPSLSPRVSPKIAQQCYEKARALAGNDPDILLLLADAYADNDDYVKAAETYEQLLTFRPDIARVRERLALNWIRADQKEKAVKVLEDILRHEPLRYEIYNYLGEIYEDMDQDDRAVIQYQQSLVVNTNQPTPYLRLAVIDMKQEKYDDALRVLVTAKERFPLAYQIPYFTGLVHSEKKEYVPAVESFATAQSLAEQSPEEAQPDSAFYFYFGAACERAGDLDRAATLFRKSIELNPDNHAALNYLGYMWADKGIHLDEAITLIQKAVEIEPDNGAYLDSLGWVLFKLGRIEEAVKPLRQAAESEKDDATVLDHLADVLLSLGQRDEAVTTLRQALEVEPQNKQIAEKLKKLTDR
ncbi:MAG: tetratricopeptide repeat protein [Verrucomicrobiia bacterium]